MKQIFQSKNISFVEVSEDLVEDYLTMVNDVEKVAKLIGRTELVSEEKERRWVRKKLEEKAEIYSMIEKKTGEFIGNIEFMDSDGTEAELGVAITAAKQDKGFGTEAVRAAAEYAMEKMRLRRVRLKVFPDNARAIRAYEKCGFREYGRTERDVFMELVR